MDGGFDVYLVILTSPLGTETWFADSYADASYDIKQWKREHPDVVFNWNIQRAS